MIKLSYCLVCDHIRIEKSNKLILIGVYGGEIIVEKFPALLSISFHCSFIVEGEEKINIEFEIHYPGDDSPRKAGISINVEKGTKHANINLPGVPLKIDESGEIYLKYRTTGSRWKKILSCGVRAGEIAI